jgi:hypothetical protein
MPYECIKACQIELSPGVFKFITEGQTELEPGIPIKHVRPISRKYFRLTGDDIKKDLKDKRDIKRALDKRKCHYNKNGSTSDLAKVLAQDNARRGIANLASLKIESPSTHLADSKVINAKKRIDELFEFSDKEERPYDDDTSIDELHKIIADKEAELLDDDDDDPDDSIESLRARCDERGISYHHNHGKEKLKELLAKDEENGE